MNASGAAQFRSIQVLRAIAAVSVVFFHLKNGASFGRFGVDIFFVLSGYVIAMVVGGGQRPLPFILHRIARVVPLYWMATSAIFMLALAMPTLFLGTQANAGNLLKSLFFLPYFKESGGLYPMLTVGWTLNYEMFFYLAVTAALLLRPGGWMWGAAAIVALGYGLGQQLPQAMAWGSFLHCPLLFEFMFGLAAYRWRGVRVGIRIPNAAYVMLALLSYAAMAAMDVQRSGDDLLRFGVPSLLLVIALTQLEPLFASNRHWAMRLAVHLGNASYAIYLTHYYLVEGVRNILAPRLPLLALDTFVGATLTIAAALAIGTLTYRWIDRPATRFAKTWLTRLLLRRGLRNGRA